MAVFKDVSKMQDTGLSLILEMQKEITSIKISTNSSDKIVQKISGLDYLCLLFCDHDRQTGG